MDRKVCIVTGASRGMGRGTALVLARDKGCRVYATARNAEALKQLAEEASAGSLGGEIIPFPLDHGKDADVEQFVRYIGHKEKAIDLLVNSAYGGLVEMAPHFSKSFWEKPISVFDAAVNIGLRGTFVMSRSVAPLMVKRKQGLIIQISSPAINYAFDVGYGVAHAGIDRLSADMASELQPFGVKALTLFPGPAVTETTSFPQGESSTFCGRGVAALLFDADNKTMERYNGKALLVYELAEQFGFTDANGRLPEGPMSGKEFTQQVREQMSKPVLQYDLNADLIDAGQWNNDQMASFFKGDDLKNH